MTTRQISLLLVGDGCVEIQGLLHHTRWRVHTAHSVDEAKAVLQHQAVQVVLCQHTLRDATWMDILDAAGLCDPPAAVVVLSRADDRVWAEVLNIGGFDLLPTPLNASELYAIVPEAWRHCMRQEHVRAAAV
jgi:DNA-binding NtrC family response regulator